MNDAPPPGAESTGGASSEDEAGDEAADEAQGVTPVRLMPETLGQVEAMVEDRSSIIFGVNQTGYWTLDLRYDSPNKLFRLWSYGAEGTLLDGQVVSIVGIGRRVGFRSKDPGSRKGIFVEPGGSRLCYCSLSKLQLEGYTPVPKSTILHGSAEIRQNFDHVSIATHASRRAQKKSIKKARFTFILAQVYASDRRVD